MKHLIFINLEKKKKVKKSKDLQIIAYNVVSIKIHRYTKNC